MIKGADLRFTYKGPHDSCCERWVDQEYKEDLGLQTVALHVRDYVRIVRRNAGRMGSACRNQSTARRGGIGQRTHPDGADQLQSRREGGQEPQLDDGV